MEEPTRFDLWGQAVQGSHELMLQWMTTRSPGRTRLENLRRISESLRAGAAIKLDESLGWAETLRSIEKASGMFQNVRIFQEGYGPQDENNMTHCPQHSIAYAGCLGCPVCSGRNAP